MDWVAGVSVWVCVMAGAWAAAERAKRKAAEAAIKVYRTALRQQSEAAADRSAEPVIPPFSRAGGESQKGGGA